MVYRKALRPRLEPLESKTVLSAGVGAGAVAALLNTSAAARLARAAEQTLSLTGSADGHFTSTLSHHSSGTEYQVSASGTLTPIGAAVVNGSFHAPGSNGGKDFGNLTIVGEGGTLRLKLTPEKYLFSARAGNSVNPGGPMIPVGSPIVDIYTYTITRGTGQYAHDHGTGTVEITIKPASTGTDSSSTTAPADHGAGQTTITFVVGRVPLPF
jgi:hypothetical protein